MAKSDPPTLKEFNAVEKETQALKDENTVLARALEKTKRSLSQIRAHKIKLEEVITQAAKAAFATMKQSPGRPPKKDGRRGGEVAVFMIADLQLGKITPDYDSEVAEKRMRLYLRKGLDLVEIQRAEHPVRKAHVWILGDIVEGENIFPGQAHLIDASLLEQTAVTGPRLIWEFLEGLLESFDEIKVSCVVGNHGRVGRKGEFHPETNMDRMLYFIVRTWFKAKGEKRIKFDIPTYEKGDRGWYAIDHIGNYSCLLIHGDQFRGGGGISGLPYPSIVKKSLYWRDAAQDGQMPVFDDIACGHWHVNATIPVGTQQLRIAGSMESYNVWSQEFLSRTQRPSQRIMFVHPGRGMVTNEYTVWLD